MHRIAVIVFATVLGGALPALVYAASAGSAPPAKVTTTCQSCHGATGNSPSGSVPRLNGQQAGYIVSRLHDFLDPTREDPHATKTMWGVVTKLDSTTFPDIADYYAHQSATPRGSSANAAGGKALFLHGAAGVPACAGCHGLEGQGGSAAPRLAGQHRDYLTNQLQRLQLGLRYSDVMHPNLKAMTDAQAASIVAYLGRD